MVEVLGEEMVQAVIDEFKRAIGDKTLDMKVRQRMIDHLSDFVTQDAPMHEPLIDHFATEYVEYDQYELHVSIGSLVADLIPIESVDEALTSLIRRCHDRDLTVINRRVAVVHLS